MKRRTRTIIIILAVFVILLILVWPMAPIWQKLGAEPVCIQGTFPRIKLAPCSGGTPEELVTALPLPTVGAEGPLPLIFDDDGSPDGMIALLYFLENPLFDVKAVTISYGEAHPEQFAPVAARLLAALGYPEIPVGYGQDSPLSGTNAFPESWRQPTADFWGISLPPAADAVTPRPAVSLLIETISASSVPVTIFISGSHTNLAAALQQEPSIAENIAAVYIMGGAVAVPGNIHSDYPEYDNETAEWNIWVDTLAADQVFTSGLDLHLVPLDATSRVLWSGTDAVSWQEGSALEGDIAAGLLRMMLSAWSVQSAYIWDLVAALQTSLPSLCPEQAMSLQVVTTPGVDEGRLVSFGGPPNVSVCLAPQADRMKSLALSAFQQP